MYRNKNPYIPKTMDDVRDFLGSMMLSAPKLVDETGYFADRNIDTEFFALNEGLKAIQKEVGEDNFHRLAELSAQMRTHFEADPDDKTGEASNGRKCIVEMQEIIRATRRHKW